MISGLGNLFSDWFGTDSDPNANLQFCDPNGNNCVAVNEGTNYGNNIFDAFLGTPQLTDLTSPKNLVVKAPADSLLDSNLTGSQIVSQTASDAWNAGISNTVSDININSLDPSYSTSPNYNPLVTNPTVTGTLGAVTGLAVLAGLTIIALQVFKKL